MFRAPVSPSELFWAEMGLKNQFVYKPFCPWQFVCVQFVRGNCDASLSNFPYVTNNPLFFCNFFFWFSDKLYTDKRVWFMINRVENGIDIISLHFYIAFTKSLLNLIFIYLFTEMQTLIIEIHRTSKATMKSVEKFCNSSNKRR